MSSREPELLPVKMADGTRSIISVFTTEGDDNTSPVVICMPAMGVSASFYDPFAASLAATGLNAVTADLRGIGHHSARASRTTQFGYYEMVYFDWPATVSTVKKRFPSNRLVMLGHSLGGQLSCLYAAVHPGAVDALILIASGSVYYRGWRFPHNLGVLFSTQLLKLISGILGYFPGQKAGFGGTESAKLIRDWAHEARTGRYKLTDSPHDLEALLGTVRVPVLAISLEGDFFAPPSALRNLLAKMNQSRITQMHLSSQDLGMEQLDHFRWMKSPEPLARQIADWLNFSLS